VIPTPAPVATTAPAIAPAQQPSSRPQQPSTDGAQFETAPTPAAAISSGQALPVSNSSPPGAQPTPVAVNLPAGLANAILQGYTNYWAVRVSAMRDPADNTIDLEGVMAGTELAVARKTMADYQSRGEAYYSDVHHQIWITSASASDATVVDVYTVTSQPLDPQTKEPLNSAPIVEHARDQFQLQLVDGAWKVVDEPPED